MIIKIEGHSKEYVFSELIEPKERLVEVNKMLSETIEITEKMSVDQYFKESFTKSANTKFNLEKIGTYLSKFPDQQGSHDKDILSRNDILEMNKGVRWKTKKGKRVLIKSRYIPFSNLNKTEQTELGLLEPSNESM